jgi:hypothetical protein
MQKAAIAHPVPDEKKKRSKNLRPFMGATRPSLSGGLSTCPKTPGRTPQSHPRQGTRFRKEEEGKNPIGTPQTKKKTTPNQPLPSPTAAVEEEPPPPNRLKTSAFRAI